MSYGYGTVYQRKDGKWTAAVDMPRRRGETRRRKTFSGLTRELVEARLAAFRIDNPPIEHPGRATLLEAARKLGTHTEGEWWALVRRVERRCYYCGIKTTVHADRAHPSHLGQDHKIPLSRGGSDAIDNIAVACSGCNSDKGTMTEAEFIAWRAAS